MQHLSSLCTSTGANISALHSLVGKDVYLEEYGCTFNHADTLALVEVLKAQGCTIVLTPEEADAVVLNTCTVIGPTERLMLRQMRRYSGHDLYLTGCMPAVQMDAICEVCSPKVIPPEEIRAAYTLVNTTVPSAIGVVQVGQGCAGRCTYCITRNARGPLQSFQPPDIYNRVQQAVGNGAVEVQLTGQDLSSWGLDLGRTLPDLLRGITAFSGDYRLRLGMMNPATVLPIQDDLIAAYRSDRIFRFLHLPIQSGSDRVLAAMNRGYTTSDVRYLVRAFREVHPDITLMTDLIVGFPGETDQDFAETLQMITALSPNKVNVTRYSGRPGTPATDLPDLQDSVKKDRSRAVNDLVTSLYHQKNSRWIGEEVDVVVTEQRKLGSVITRDERYQNIVIPEPLPFGMKCRVQIEQDCTYYFTGSLA
jgi:MiaB-like tRNA modifying enzyme